MHIPYNIRSVRFLREKLSVFVEQYQYFQDEGNSLTPCPFVRSIKNKAYELPNVKSVSMVEELLSKTTRWEDYCTGVQV